MSKKTHCIIVLILSLVLVCTCLPVNQVQAEAGFSAVTAFSQDDINSALKNTQLTSLQIKLSGTAVLMIPKGTYPELSISINAP